jgi:integrase
MPDLPDQYDPKSVTKRKPLRNLPIGVGVGKVSFRGCERWRVRLGKRFTRGKVQTRSFDTLNEAREWIFGTEGGAKSAVLEMVEEGIVQLRAEQGGDGFVLTGAQRGEAIDAFRRLPSGTSLTQVVDFYLERTSPGGGIKTFEETAEEFLGSRRNMGVRDRTYTLYESHLRIIGEVFGGTPIADMRRSQIEDWLAESEWAPRTRKNYLVTLTTLLNFAQDRDYCAGNAAARIERPILEDKPPGILTVEEATALLRTCSHGVPAKEDRKEFSARPQMISGIAIGLFAGLRRSEICRLEWSEVDLDDRFIEIKASKAKTRQRRLVTVGENLLEWLKLAPKTSGLVAVSTNEDVFGEHLKEIAEAAGITPWPHNALRHSFGSYFYAKTSDENKTAAEMGNSPGMIFKHYRALVKATEAARFWAIAPAKQKAQ